MKKLKIKISYFNRYLILSIIFLFTCLFYFLLPALYDYKSLQKQLEAKLLEEYGIRISLTEKITYKILPSPNFEIDESILYLEKKDKNNEFAKVKKLKVFVSARTLYKQEEIIIKRAVFEESVFNFNRNSWKFIKNYLQKPISNNKIFIKKSKIFIKKNSNNGALAIFSIKNLEASFNNEKNNNNLNIVGNMFNSPFKFSWQNDLNFSGKSKSILKLSDINLGIKNEIQKSIFEDKILYVGNQKLNFFGSQINTKYKFDDKLLTFLTKESKVNNIPIFIKGDIYFSPFFFKAKVNLKKINLSKIFNQKFLLNDILNNNIYSHNNFNGNIMLNVDELQRNKVFDSAKFNINFKNGKITFDDTKLTSIKFGNLKFIESELIEVNNKNVLRAKLEFNINNQKKFYQRFQIAKNLRKPLDKINLSVDKDLNSGDLKIYSINIYKNGKKYDTQSVKSYLESIDNEINTDSIYTLNNFLEDTFKLIN